MKIFHFLKPKRWRITYLDCCGAMSIYEEEEFYFARTRYGAWKKFRQHHGKNLPIGYTDRTNFEYDRMKNDIIQCD